MVGEQCSVLPTCYLEPGVAGLESGWCSAAPATENSLHGEQDSLESPQSLASWGRTVNLQGPKTSNKHNSTINSLLYLWLRPHEILARDVGWDELPTFICTAPTVGWMKCDSSVKAFAAADFPLNLFAICSKTGDMMLDWPPADHQPVVAWLSIGYSGGLRALNYKCQSKLLESAQWIAHQYVKDERRHDGDIWDFCFLRTYFRRRGMFKRKEVVVLPSFINFYLSYGYIVCSLGESICLPMLQKGRRGTYLFLMLIHIYISDVTVDWSYIRQPLYKIWALYPIFISIRYMAQNTDY